MLDHGPLTTFAKMHVKTVANYITQTWTLNSYGIHFDYIIFLHHMICIWAHAVFFFAIWDIKGVEVSSKFWIISGRGLVRAIVHSFVVCRRFEGKPIGAPPQPPLLEFQVKEAPPFAYTAVDFAVHHYLRGKEANVSKVWIRLFTCCVSRAVHFLTWPLLHSSDA